MSQQWAVNREQLYRAIQVAEEIPGWMNKTELFWLGMEAARRHSILEIGCWQGRSTKMLATMTPGTVVSVDDFRGEVDEPMSGADLRAAFYKHLDPELSRGAITHFNLSSGEFADFWNGAVDEPRGFDMIFIDGGHDYDSVIHDCNMAKSFIAPGGVICGHDWFQPDVKRAAMESFKMAAPVGAGSIWKVLMM